MKHRPPRTFVTATCAGLAFCAALLPPLAAGARDLTASDHAKRGRVAYDLQDWATAVSEYRAAYEAEQNGDYLFGLAQAQRQSGNYAAAIYTFKAYKRLEGVSAEQMSAADLLIGKCEAERAKVEAAQAAAAKPPVQGPENLPSAPTALAAQRVQPPFEAAGAGGARAEPTRRAFYEDVLGDGLFIAGLAAAGVGGGLLVSGNSAMREIAAERTESEARDAADAAHRAQLGGSLLLPVGGVLVVAGVWRWISGGSDAPRAVESLSLGPGYVGYSGQF